MIKYNMSTKWFKRWFQFILIRIINYKVEIPLFNWNNYWWNRNIFLLFEKSFMKWDNSILFLELSFVYEISFYC